jgi:hypothetical protein
LEYKDTIVKTFQSLGMALNPDGSEDAELKVKGIPDIAVGNYQRQDGLNQKEDAEEALTLAVAAAAKKEDNVLQEEDILNALSEGNEDGNDDDDDKDTDLLPPRPQRTKCLPA